MLQDEIIFEHIERCIPNFETFEKKLITHVRSNYFPLIYQCLYEKIMLDYSQISTDDYKILLRNNYLELINDIYRTRLSNNAFPIILERLDKVKDFNEYEIVLKQFECCNPKKNGNVNALSLGTKVLHSFNPEENPIIDSVVRNNLGINYNMDINLCMNFKKAMNKFANKHKEYFILDESNIIKYEFEKYKLKPMFPKMKILDMALY